MVNLFEEYPAQNKQAPINLLEEYNPLNQPGTEEEALELAKKQISQQHPNLPDWLRDAILHITPKQESPMLASAARGVSRVTNVIPQVASGLLQGASIPIRGVAGLVPTEFTQKLANSPDLTNLAPKPETEGQQNFQNAAELVGGGGAFGKLFQGAKYAANAAKIPKAVQNAAALTTAGAVGTPGDAEDRAIGAGEALGLGAAGKVAGKVAGKLPKFIKSLFSPSTTEDLVQAVQKPHDTLQNAADELYGQVQGAINGRKIKIPISEELLEQAKEHFPKNTRSYNELLERAKAGDYDAIHKIQSSLYKKGTKALSSDDLAVENQGEDILDLRNKINDELTNKLIQEGHLDIAHVLSQGKKLYSELQNTYFPKHLRKGIGKLVHPETRLVPENPENLFKENSVPMKAFLEKHPEVKKHSENIRAKKEAEETLKKILLRTGGAGATIAGTKALYDLLD